MDSMAKRIRLLRQDQTEDFMIALAKLARDQNYSDDVIEAKASNLAALVFEGDDAVLAKSIEEVDAVRGNRDV
jgi:hypothetical protein